MLAGIFLFNRLWLPFPMSDVGQYLDFYGGFGTRFGWPSVLRILECLAFIGVGMLSRAAVPFSWPDAPRLLFHDLRQ